MEITAGVQVLESYQLLLDVADVSNLIKISTFHVKKTFPQIWHLTCKVL